MLNDYNIGRLKIEVIQHCCGIGTQHTCTALHLLAVHMTHDAVQKKLYPALFATYNACASVYYMSALQCRHCMTVTVHCVCMLYIVNTVCFIV